MARFSRLRLGSLILAALPVLSLLVTSTAADARPLSPRATSGTCSAKLHGYKPTAELVYGTRVGNNLFYLDDVREKANGDISGTAIYIVDNYFHSGTFTGRINEGKIQVKGSKNTAGWSFSFSGTTTCLLSQIETNHMATDPSGKLPSTLKLTTLCDLGPAFGIGDRALAACEARGILDAIPQGPLKIPHDGMIPYSWGGGHNRKANQYGPETSDAPGPTLGTCEGYTGPGYKSTNSPKKNLKICEAYGKGLKDCGGKDKCGPTHTVGLDCSGFTRWVFYFITGSDVLGNDGTAGQVMSKKLTTGTGAPGDLVYFYTYSKKSKTNVWDHVGIVIAPGVMIDEPNTGSDLRIDRFSPAAGSMTKGYGKAVYKAYTFPIAG